VACQHEMQFCIRAMQTVTVQTVQLLFAQKHKCAK